MRGFKPLATPLHEILKSVAKGPYTVTVKCWRLFQIMGEDNNPVWSSGLG